MRRARYLAAILLAVLLLSGCSKAATADQAIKKPANVSSGPEKLLPAPTAVVEDTPDWTELPAPVAKVFAGGLSRSKFQAFAGMKQSTVSVELKKAPDDKTVFSALDAAADFVPADYSILLNVYAPGAEGKPQYHGYVWSPLAGTLVRKASTDADQGWDSAITAITQGSATDMQPTVVKSIATGKIAPPLF
jgi:hypothetical protein